MTSNRNTQKGAVLVLALSILVILTLLGVSAMRGTSLEVKMATSLQDATATFHVSESGLKKAYFGEQDINAVSGNAFNADNPTTRDYSIGGISVQVNTEKIGCSPGKRGSGYSATEGSFTHFKQTSTSTSASNARSINIQGVSKVSNQAFTDCLKTL